MAFVCCGLLLQPVLRSPLPRELHEDPTTGNETVRAFWSMVNILSRRNLWKRFGGQMIYAGFGIILYIGGVSGLGLMKCENEILEVDCNKVN